MHKQKEFDQIQQQLQILVSMIRAKTNQVGTTFNATNHTFYTSLFNLNQEEIIYRAKNAYNASERLKIFEDSTNNLNSVYFHYMDVFGPNPIPEWVNQYLKVCEYRNILSISSLDDFISSHLLSGQSLYQDPNNPSVPELSDADAPEYIRRYAKQNITDQELLEKIYQLFPPPPPPPPPPQSFPGVQPNSIYYPKLPDLNNLL